MRFVFLTALLVSPLAWETCGILVVGVNLDQSAKSSLSLWSLSGIP